MYKNLKTSITLWFACALIIVSLSIKDMIAQDTQDLFKSIEIKLYFMDPEGTKLVPEKRTISQFGNTIDQIKLSLLELISGPLTSLVPTISQGVEVREVFLDEKGCAYIDFSRAIYQNHPGGTTGELATIASIVNTLTMNFPKEIRKVMILIDGKEAKTIAGHIDISRPIFPFSTL